jgi:hypothetical protein
MAPDGRAWRSVEVRGKDGGGIFEGEVAGLGDDALGGGVEAVGVAAGAGDGAGHNDGTAAFTNFVLLGMAGDFFGLFDP